jgi:tRNA pseudouridine55 synthase
LDEKRVGHAGTLDPLATGVLVMVVGKATRIVEYLVTQDKEYAALMVLGRTTSTQDSSGEERSSVDASHITRQMVEDVLPQFTGRIMQTPPMVSAVKHKGKRLYELARKDIEVERTPREVTIHNLTVTSFTPSEHPMVGLSITCSSGTYIRTLCADIGEALGVGGFMHNLVRTRVGRFKLGDAISLDRLEDAVACGEAERLLLPMSEALPDLPLVVVNKSQAAVIANGGSVAMEQTAADGALVRIGLDGVGLLAIGKVQAQDGTFLVKPEKVFVEAQS